MRVAYCKGPFGQARNMLNIQWALHAHSDHVANTRNIIMLQSLPFPSINMTNHYDLQNYLLKYVVKLGVLFIYERQNLVLLLIQIQLHKEL